MSARTVSRVPVYKSVTLRNAAGDVFTYKGVARVFHRADGGVTIMKGSNTPAEGRVPNVVSVRTVRNLPAKG